MAPGTGDEVQGPGPSSPQLSLQDLRGQKQIPQSPESRAQRKWQGSQGPWWRGGCPPFQPWSQLNAPHPRKELEAGLCCLLLMGRLREGGQDKDSFVEALA